MGFQQDEVFISHLRATTGSAWPINGHVQCECAGYCRELKRSGNGADRSENWDSRLSPQLPMKQERQEFISLARRRHPRKRGTLSFGATSRISDNNAQNTRPVQESEIMGKRERCVALVSNKAYLEKALLTIWLLRVFGRYRGDVVLVVGDDLRESIATLKKSILRITPAYFPDVRRNREDALVNRAPTTVDSQRKKTFQFHKFHCFSPYFKRWRKVLYLDAKMRIYGDLDPLFQLDCSNSLIAHSDSFPSFESSLGDQFNFEDFPLLRKPLSTIADLDSDYFQTTMMYFDTSIITSTTVQELIDLSKKFPNSRTNDQGIINIWAKASRLWRPLPTEKHEGRFLYDFHERPGHLAKDYLMVKYPKLARRDFAWLLQARGFELLRRVERRLINL